MGLIRFLLAAAVITAHSHLYFGLPILTGGSDSVKLFFMISGFYIAFILLENSTYKESASKFFYNRFLRLFPLYWVTLILYIPIAYYITCVREQAMNPFSDLTGLFELNAIQLSVLFVSHVFPLGHEWFFSFDFIVPSGFITA
jgi:peptidoglycan/LPS O-acetylase OafA/YrhL